MLIPQVGSGRSGRSGNRPSGTVGSGSGIALLCVPRVGNYLAKLQVTDLVGKMVFSFRAC